MTRGQLWRPVGWLVAAIALVYFFRYAWRSLPGTDLSPLLDGKVIAALAALCGLYMLLIPVTALAWSWLLREMGEDVGVQRTLPILATAQFGKYLPGNIAQHVGRVALLRRSNVGMSTAVLSVVYETLLLLVACVHLSGLTLLWELPSGLARWSLLTHRGVLLVALTGAAALALFLLPRLANRLAAWRSARQDGPPAGVRHAVGWPTALGCYLLYATNFTLVGAGMYLVAAALAAPGENIPAVAYMTGAFASSWVVGFLAPGAPAGLGVREVVLSAWLAAVMPADEVVLTTVALRLATTGGDALSFALGGAALRHGFPNREC